MHFYTVRNVPLVLALEIKNVLGRPWLTTFRILCYIIFKAEQLYIVYYGKTVFTIDTILEDC